LPLGSLVLLQRVNPSVFFFPGVDVKESSVWWSDSDELANMQLVPVCQAYFKWVWLVSNSLLVDERTDPRKLKVHCKSVI